MASIMLNHETKVRSPKIQMTTLQEVAEAICADALQQTQAKIDPFQKEPNREDLFRRNDFFDSLKYNLAKGVANTLAAYDNHVLAVYLSDPSVNPDAETGENLPIDTIVHLLVLVRAPSAALKTFTASLDRALVQHLKDLPLPLPAKCSSILDVMLVTEKEVERGTGYASLLRSIFAPPLKIWQRDS